MWVKTKTKDVIKAIIALPGAMILVTLVAFSVSAPLDPYQAEARISEYQESLQRGDGREEGFLADTGARADPPSKGSTDGPPFPGRANYFVRMAGFTNWYPVVFGGALFCLWAFLRPALGPFLPGGSFVVLSAFCFGPKAGVSALAASIGYLAFAIGRRAWPRGMVQNG